MKEGEGVGSVPSGTRTSEEVPLKRGAVTIAGSSQVPIVPVAYTGPNNFKDLLKRIEPKIIYCEPLYLPEGMSKKEGMEVMTKELNEELSNLQKELKEN